MADLASSIAAASNSGASLRTAVLTAVTGTTITVDVGGGTLIDCPYLDLYRPALGDPVQLLQQGPTLLALGATNALPGYDPDTTPLTNPSFEADPPGAVVTDWTTVVSTATPGTAAVTVAGAGGIGPKHGTQWLQVIHTGTGVSTVAVVSAPIPVQAGQRWAAGAATTTSTDAAGPAAMTVTLAFFAAAAGVYPTDVTSSQVQASAGGATGAVWLPVAVTSGNGTTVPDAATAMRVILGTAFTAGTVSWDRVLCRRLA